MDPLSKHCLSDFYLMGFGNKNKQQYVGLLVLSKKFLDGLYYQISYMTIYGHRGPFKKSEIILYIFLFLLLFLFPTLLRNIFERWCIKVWLSRYSWGAGKLGSECSSWFRRLECITWRFLTMSRLSKCLYHVRGCRNSSEYSKTVGNFLPLLIIRLGQKNCVINLQYNI